MSQRHPVTLHQSITVNDDMFNHRDGVMRALAKQETQWEEDLFFTVKLAQQKLSKFLAQVTPSTGIVVIAAHILDHSQTLQLVRK